MSWAASLDHGLMMVRNEAIRYLLTRPSMNIGDMVFLSIQIQGIFRKLVDEYREMFPGSVEIDADQYNV